MAPVLERSQIAPRVRHCIAATLAIPEGEVTDDLSFGSTPQWDSMGHMTLILALEQEFGVAFESYQIADLTSVPAIVAALAEQAQS